MTMEASDQSPGTRHDSLRTRSPVADRPSESSLAPSSSGQVNRRSQNAQLLRNRLRQLLVRIRWFNLAVVTLLPLLAFYGACTTKFQHYTSLFSVWCYFLNMLGVTAGYHRLWSHRSYNAAKPLQLFLAMAGGGAMQGSIQWWARGHRSHHRYTDTDLDPYSANVGFWHTHVGWMLVKPKIKPGTADVSDLKRNPVVVWQHRLYFYIAFIFGLIMPTCIPGYFWGDWRGGFFVAGCMRLTFVHHSVFSVNSVAHWLGDTTFDDRLSPRDHFVTALLTLGEGYHNFHHQFPVDYRNAVKWYQYDPTKWFIALCSFLGLASHLRVFPDSEVRMGQLTMQLKQLKKEQDQLKKPLDPRELPVVDWDEFQRQSESRLLVMISGFIHDVSAFTEEHPGGKSLITSHRGKDATAAFFGGVYDHSNAAHNLLAGMRVGILQGGLEHIAQTAIPPWRRLEIVDHISASVMNKGDAQVSFSISAFSPFSPKLAHYIGREKSPEEI